MSIIEKDVIHVINSKGEHLTIPFVEKPKANEEIYKSYTIDDEWYRTHGYVSREEHQKIISKRSIGKNDTRFT